MADTSDNCGYKVEKAHDRLDNHEEALDHHDRRITQNENWRLQIQGALKIIAFILGAGGLAVIIDWGLALI